MEAMITEENYTGVHDSAAESQQVSNTYQLESQDYPQDHSADAGKMVDHSGESNEMVEEAPSRQELNFRALREEVEKIKAEKQALQQSFEQLRYQQSQQPQERLPEKKMFQGVEDDYVPNVGEIRREWNEKEAEYLGRIEELQVASVHPDYAEVMEKYTAPLIKEKPHLAEGILGARNKALFAYELGKMAQSMRQPQQQSEQQQPSKVAQKIVENARKPATLSGAGGQGHLSKADYYASMSDAEFMTMASRYLE